MPVKLGQASREAAVRLIRFQVTVVLVIAICFGVFAGQQAAWSAALGGGIYVVPNAIFALLAFAFAGARQAKNVVLSFYLGEALKLVLTIAFFAIVLSSMDGDLLALFVTFALAIVSQWFAPLFFKPKERDE